MRKLFGILLAGLVFAGVARAQDSDVSVDFSVDGLSGYIWRGDILGADDKFVLQPALNLTLGESGLTAGAWGSIFAQKRSTLESKDEIDLWADYTTALGEDSPVSLSVGFIEYLFPNGASGEKHSEEAYVGLSLDNQLAPSVTFYYDFGLADDYYISVGVGPSLPLGEGDDAPSLDIGASVSFSGDFYGGSAGFNDVTLTVSISFAAGQLSITPMAGITIPDDGYAHVTTFWGGISIGFGPASE